MHFGFALDLSDIDLLNVDLLDQRYTHLDLFVSKTSSRHVFKTFSRYVFKTSSRHVFKTSSRCPQRNNFSSSKTSWRRLQDVFKTSGKTKNCYAEDVLKNSSRHVLQTSSRRLEGQQMFAGYSSPCSSLVSEMIFSGLLEMQNFTLSQSRGFRL